MNSSIDPIINAYLMPDNIAIQRIPLDSESARVLELWLENHPREVSHSPMLKELKDRVYHLSIESKILSGNIEFFNSHPEVLIKNLELIQTQLNLDIFLPLLLDKLSASDLKALLRSRLNAAPHHLSPSQYLRLSSLADVELDLPPYAQNFRQMLKLPQNLDHCVQYIRGLEGLTEEETDMAMAHFIEHYYLPLKKINLTDEELLRLAPHLRYVDLIGFENIPLANALLKKCSNLNVLGIDNDKILENVTELPFCEKLYCAECTNLQALPALPLCKELNCNNCYNLRSLPALPQCKNLDCRYCPLIRLPELPCCENLDCKGCGRLSALPALPFCKELCCKNCTNLQALPELPLCKKLECKGCTKLTVMTALPLCTWICCDGCTNLQSFPDLPLCEKLFCRDCINLQALPALLLCDCLYCSGCTNIQALPALSTSNFSVDGCTNLTTLPLSLGQCRYITHINIEGTGIDPAIRDAILNQCRLMREAEAVKVLPMCLAKWKAIAKSDADLDVSALTVEQKKTLNEWLVRMERTQDFTRSQSLLAQTVCNILADLVKNKEFQELFFPQAEANNECCGDRAAMSLNEIYTSWMVLCKSGDLQMLTGVAKTLRLRKELQQLIHGREGEPVEIFLYYETTLSERLQLVTAIKSMLFGTIGNRSWIDQEKLVLDVEAHFFEELFDLPVFEKMIVFDDLEFSTKLEALGDCPEGAPNDPQVLNYLHRQGEIMQEWKRAKMRAAKEWYDQALSD